MNTSQVIKHIAYNTDPHLLTDYCVANTSWEYIHKVTIMIKKLQKMDTGINDI
jgi:predicted MarR family transcription regulator